jgi:hypothetical protein
VSADEEVLWKISISRERVKNVYIKSLTYGLQEMILLTAWHLDFQQLLLQMEMRSLVVQCRAAWEMTQLDETGMAVVIQVWRCWFRPLEKLSTLVIGGLQE